MKDFRKTENGFFICEECGIITKRKSGLSKHINIHHINVKTYFDKWIKDIDDDKCKICKKETKYLNIKTGYKNTCCKKCENLYKHNRTKEECIKKYGVEHPLQDISINEKQKQSMINVWGVSNPGQSNELKLKKKKTFVLRYKCENPLQIKTIFYKTQISGYNCKLFKNTTIYYRGSYELDFLEKYYDIYPDIENGPSIKYKIGVKNKIYYPDFFIPSLNLIIECKNSYLAKKDKKLIKIKENACIENGFNYCIIINKQYENLRWLKN